MKLDESDSFVRAGKKAREFSCDVGLSGAWRSVKDDLTLLRQQPQNLIEELRREKQIFGEVVDCFWRFLFLCKLPTATRAFDVFPGELWEHADQTVND